jgi:hypothetical protein
MTKEQKQYKSHPHQLKKIEPTAGNSKKADELGEGSEE